ncbi:uncharacterized protein K441DRAFT_258027 [Cenococcum geophilum 1.58]|uniref:uncharacterized protein n=1 Tax=Cenococcum geophilum 1.58 TaxID=794803 RepID=UPI00358E394E|nr:hypothetical protein K441DRAFT_258027 [Cenococcum geophilum 1.58]
MGSWCWNAFSLALTAPNVGSYAASTFEVSGVITSTGIMTKLFMYISNGEVLSGWRCKATHQSQHIPLSCNCVQ